METIGIAYPHNYTSRNNYSSGGAAQNNGTSVSDIWKLIFLNGQNGAYFLSRFANQVPGWWKTALFSTQLSPLGKFEYIFGITLPGSRRQDHNTRSHDAGQLLGDIVNWFTDLFSKQNLQAAAEFLRQGEIVANNIANGVIGPGAPAQISSWSSFWNKWGDTIVAAGLLFGFIYVIKN